MSYIIIDKTRFSNYGFDKDGKPLWGEYVLPYPGDNEAHTYETVDECIEYIVQTVLYEEKSGYADFAIAEIKEIDRGIFWDKVNKIREERANES